MQVAQQNTNVVNAVTHVEVNNKQTENIIPIAVDIPVFSLIKINTDPNSTPTTAGKATLFNAGSNLESFHIIHGAKLIKNIAGTRMGVITVLK